MIIADILTFTYSAPKTKTLTLTRITRLNSRLSVELASKDFAVIVEANISVLPLTNILPNLELYEVLPFMTHLSIMECQSGLIAHFLRRCEQCFMLVNSRDFYGAKL